MITSTGFRFIWPTEAVSVIDLQGLPDAFTLNART